MTLHYFAVCLEGASASPRDHWALDVAAHEAAAEGTVEGAPSMMTVLVLLVVGIVLVGGEDGGFW
jgi:hypothetical protein